MDVRKYLKDLAVIATPLVTALGIREATARAAPPAPPESPTGSIALEALATERTVTAKVTIRASAGTLPITAEVHCTLDSAEKTETVTITELNKDYTVEFSFPVTESGTYTVRAWAVLKNVVGETTVGPQWQTIPVEVYKPFTITVRAMADSTEVNVDVIGEFPTGTYTTPFEITITEDLRDKVLTFKFPSRVDVNGIEYTLTSVSNGSIISAEDQYTIVKVLADTAKEVVAYYTKVEARWYWSEGAYGQIYVWDCWYERATKTVYVDLTVIPGRTGKDYDMVSATVIAKDTPHHGFLYASGITGHRLIKFTIKYDWYIDYGVEIDAQWRYGGMSPAITIRRSEIREV